ncbi:IPT/TIG domain-containing protein [Actinoplanes sp. NPDC023936]|uniref:beta strand repeat-containing protein n=1 Tax=Actinoplanes sp. NPDC023936 TaxID=3154910 RepID=UPI0033BFD930
MSKSNPRARLAYAGLSIGALGAALLVGPQAAHAAVALSSITPSSASAGTLVTVVAPSSIFTQNVTPVVTLTTGNTTCSATSNGSTIIDATGEDAANSGGATATMTFVMPGGLGATAGSVARNVNLCIYVSGTLQNDPATISALPPITPNAGVPGTAVTATFSSATATGPFAAATPTVLFSSAVNCPGTNATSTTAFAATNVAKSGNYSVTFNVPPGISSAGVNRNYLVCVYTGASTLLSDSGSPRNFTVRPTISPSGAAAGSTVTIRTAAPLAGGSTPGVVMTTNLSCPTNYTTTISGQTTAAGTNVTRVDENTATFTIPSTLALSSGGARAYNVCLYAGATTTSAQLADPLHAFILTPGVALSAQTGTSGGGNTLTFTAPTGSAPFTDIPGVVFTTTGCPGTYGSPGGGIATSIVRTSTSVVTATVPTDVLATGLSTPYTVCFYGGTATSDVLIAAAAAPYTILLSPVTLSSSVGSSAGTSPGAITVSSTTAFLVGVSAPGVAFTTAATCPAIYPSNVPFAAASGNTPVVHGVIQASAPRVVSTRSLAVVVPALPLSLGTPTPYQMCVYNGTNTSTSTLIAVATYTSTTVHTLVSVSPRAGSALGGDEIVITGTGFPTTPGSITATLGGVPLIDVTPVNATTFTAITPIHAPENGVPLVVTTFAGTRTLASSFSYLHALKADPNTAPNTRPIDIAVRGADFLNVTFGANDADAHIYLVRGEYNSRTVVSAGNKVNGPVQECGSVLVITDNDLVCTLNLHRRLGPDGAQIAQTTAALDTRAAADTAVAGTGDRLITSAANALFTYADIGKTVTGIGFAPNTVIVDVTPASGGTVSSATISRGTTGAHSGGTTIVSAARSVPLVVTGNASANVTAPPGSFTQGDVGRPITGGNIDTATTISVVAPGGASATLSKPTTATTGGTHTVSVFGAPVPNGAYNLTYVSNGSPDAVTADPNYRQSVLSSGSVFTVAPF